MTYDIMCTPHRSAPARTSGKGNHWWARDVHHVVDWSTKRSLCGRDASGWLKIDVCLQQAIKSPNCCALCARKA